MALATSVLYFQSYNPIPAKNKKKRKNVMFITKTLNVLNQKKGTNKKIIHY